MIVMGLGGDGVEHGEGNEANNHHLEKFQEVIANEGNGGNTGLLIGLVFAHETEGAEKKEQWYAVMTEERKEMQRQ